MSVQMASLHCETLGLVSAKHKSTGEAAMATSGINKRAIAKYTRDIQREFEKNPIRVPIEGDTSGIGFQPAGTVTNYHGPVVTVTGDNAQIAWDSETVEQSQNNVSQIVPGYEQLAQLLTDMLANLSNFTLGEDDETDARENAQTVLREVVKEKPDQGIVRRSVNMLKGVFAPIASGAAAGVSAESTESARTLIEMLGTSLPF